MSGPRVSVVVDGWTFTREPGWPYVHPLPPGCESSNQIVPYITVDDPDLSQEDLRSLAIQWLSDHRRHLRDYIVHSRPALLDFGGGHNGNPDKRAEDTKKIENAMDRLMGPGSFFDRFAAPIVLGIIILMFLSGDGGGGRPPESPYYR
jgi:hypothetical protein